MFILCADKNVLSVCRAEPLTSGSIQVYAVRFVFSDDWKDMTRTAVFRAGDKTAAVLLDDSGECLIPQEVLSVSGRQLEAGVYGTGKEDAVLPTIWTKLGFIQTGAAPKGGSGPAAPTLLEQALAGKGDRLDYTPAGELGLYAGDKLLSSVPVAGGGTGGVSDHRLLTNRGAEGQHPIEAIKGLAEELKRIPEPVEPLNNEELEEILK